MSGDYEWMWERCQTEKTKIETRRGQKRGRLGERQTRERGAEERGLGERSGRWIEPRHGEGEMKTGRRRVTRSSHGPLGTSPSSRTQARLLPLQHHASTLYIHQNSVTSIQALDTTFRAPRLPLHTHTSSLDIYISTALHVHACTSPPLPLHNNPLPSTHRHTHEINQYQSKSISRIPPTPCTAQNRQTHYPLTQTHLPLHRHKHQPSACSLAASDEPIILRADQPQSP